MLKHQAQMSAIRNQHLPLPNQDVENWLAHLNAVDFGIQSLMSIAQGEANSDELMKRLLPLRTWLHQQADDSPCPEVEEAVEVVESTDANATEGPQQQPAEVVSDEELEQEEEVASEFPKHSPAEAERRQPPSQQPLQQETAAPQQPLGNALKSMKAR
jgi:hypothetical protein